MKTFKTSSIVSVAMIVCLSLASFKSFAQHCGIQTENDGFQWERICQGDKEGAKSMGGVTFIPLSRGYTFIYYTHIDAGFGYFRVDKGNKESGVCDITGREIIAPGRYDKAYYRNKDGFEFVDVELNGKEGACDRNGREIVAPRYESLFLSSEGVFKYKDASGEYVSTGITIPKSGSSSYASNYTSSSSNNGSKASTSTKKSYSGKENDLLYEGMYNCGPSVYPNGMSFPPLMNSMDIQVYSEEIEIPGYGKFKYQGNTKGGKRKYTSSGSIYGNQSLLVDGNYNITHYYQVNGTSVSAEYTRQDSGMSPNRTGNYYDVERQGNGGRNGSNSNNNYSGNSQTQQKQHKCGLCNGTGRVVENNATSFGNTKYCSECGKTVPDSHYHTTSPSCKGKGYW